MTKPCQPFSFGHGNPLNAVLKTTTRRRGQPLARLFRDRRLFFASHALVSSRHCRDRDEPSTHDPRFWRVTQAYQVSILRQGPQARGTSSRLAAAASG